MSNLTTSQALTAIIALTGCTAAFLVPQEASAAHVRTMRSNVTRPAPRAAHMNVRASVQSHVARQTFARAPSRQVRPSFNVARSAPTGASFARHGFGGIPHSFSALPAAHSIGGHLAHVTSLGFPRPNSIGANGAHLALNHGFPHLNGGNGLPRPNSIGTHLASNTAFQHANLTGFGNQHLALNGVGSHFGGNGAGLAGQTGGNLHGLTHANFNALAGNNHANGDHNGNKGNKGVQGSAIKLGELKQDLKNDKKKLGDDKKGLKTDNTKLTAANNAVTAAKTKEASDTKLQNALLTDLINLKANNGSPAQVNAIKDALNRANSAASVDHTSTIAAQTAAATAQKTADTAKKDVAADKKEVAGDRKDVKGAKQTLADKTKIAKENREIKQLQNQLKTQASNQSSSGDGQAASAPQASGSDASGGDQQASSGSTTAVSSSPAPAPTQVAAGSVVQATDQQLASQSAVSTPAAAAQNTPVPTSTDAQTSPEFVFVAFQKDVSSSDTTAFLDAYKVSVVDGPNQDGFYKLQLKDPIPTDQLQQLIDSMKSQTNIVSTATVS